MSLNSEQKRAVEYLEGPLLVLAGPGTGKTQLLSAKVAYILDQTDTNPENILCITFTDSGADNMRERLRSMIGRAAEEVNIYTYHQFGMNLLDRYQNYAEKVDRRTEKAIDEVTQYKIIRRIQSELPVNDILKTADAKSLSETIKNAKGYRLTSTDLRKIAERNLADGIQLGEIATEVFSRMKKGARFAQAVEQTYQPLLEKLVEHISDQPIVSGVEPIVNILSRSLSDIITSESAQEKPSASSLRKWKDKHFERNDDGSYRSKDYIANKKLLSLAHIMQEYDQALRAADMLDFSDMIEGAIKALQEDTGFRLSMSERFQFILLDEFQDTNPSQFELIRLITQYDQPQIMAVGDDDQAIFAFQGANASNMLDFQNYYGAEVVNLVDNYRSTAEILDFSHHVAEQIGDSFAKHHGIAKILHSMQEEADDKSKISRHEFPTAKQEYFWVAQQIRELINHGEKPDEIAVLAPKHKYIAPLLPYLKARDIDIAYEKKSDILDNPQIQQIIMMAEFIYQLAQEKRPEHNVLEILSYEVWEIEPLVALRAVQNARTRQLPTLDYLVESNDQKLQQVAQILAELAVLAFDTPLELWLDYLIGKQPLPRSGLTSPYLSYYENDFSDIEKLELYENLATLRDTASTHLSVSKPKLADFIQMLQDYREADVAIQTTTMHRDASSAVQIMSAHKSKGLEFKYVFLIAVDDWAWGKSKGNNNTFVLPANLSQIRHTGVTDDERLRLLFVAITRAKQYLIMTNSVEDFSGKKVNRLSYIGEQRDDKSEANVSQFLPESSREITIHAEEDLETTLAANEQAWSAAYQVLHPDLELLLRANLEHYRLTATDLTSFIDLKYAGPEAIYRRRAMRIDEGNLDAKLAYGNIMHSALEKVTNSGISDEEALELIQSEAEAQPLTEHEIDELKQLGTIGLQKTLATFAPILRDENAKGEVDFGAEHLVYDGVPVTGKIDHINIDHAAKTIEVYDFKTGNFHDKVWEGHDTLYKYALQLEFYKLLLSLSPSYRNYQIVQGHVLFVTPDQEGIVHDKVYKYTDASAEELRKLVKVIYRLITSLEFVKNPEINIVANQDYGIKEIKAFVDKLLELA